LLQENYATEEEAFNEVKRGRAWGALVFPQNYSSSLIERTESGRFTDDWVIESSDVTVRLDMSSKLKFAFGVI